MRVYKNVHGINTWLVSMRAIRLSRALKTSVDFSYLRSKGGFQVVKRTSSQILDISVLAWLF